jgi:hypothetical protein
LLAHGGLTIEEEYVRHIAGKPDILAIQPRGVRSCDRWPMNRRSHISRELDRLARRDSSAGTD